MVVRLDRLENELRQANGRIEQLENQQRLLQDQLRRFPAGRRIPPRRRGRAGDWRSPRRFRPSGRLGATDRRRGTDPVPGAKPHRGDAFDPKADPNAPGAPRPLGSTPPSAPLTAGAPLDIGGRPAAADSCGAARRAVGTDRRRRRAGQRPRRPPSLAPESTSPMRRRRSSTPQSTAYRAGQYAQAEGQFKGFLAAKRHTPPWRPTRSSISAKLIFSVRDRARRREQYLKLSTDFSKSSRAPEGLLRLGQSLAMLGSNDQACATFAEVGKRYPTAAPPIKKSAEREMQKDHC